MVTAEYVKRHYSSLQSDGSLFLAAECIDYDHLAPFLASVGVTLLNGQSHMLNLTEVMNDDSHVTIPKTMVMVVPETLVRVMSDEGMVYTLLKMESVEQKLAVVMKAVEYSM